MRKIIFSLTLVLITCLNAIAQQTIIRHTIKKGETVYGIGRLYNISPEAIIAANPGSESGIKAGFILNIPLQEKLDVKESTTPPSPKNLQDTITENQQSSAVEEASADSDYVVNESDVAETIQAINVSIILPFELQNENPSKDALLYTDFYRGFLLALDQYKDISKCYINVKAIDTENSAQKLAQLLANDKSLCESSIIFAPGENVQYKLLSDFSGKNEIPLVNSFNLRNTDYKENAYIFQTNTPQEYLTNVVIESFDKKFPTQDVLFLNFSNTDDKNIVTALREHFKQTGRNVRNVNVYSASQLIELDSVFTETSDYIVIPNNSSRTALSRTLPAIRRAKEGFPFSSVKLFGFPEWTMMIDEFRHEMELADTYLYSRFYVEKEANAYKRFDELFQETYGSTPIESSPNFAILGYDTGFYFLSIIANCSSNSDSEKLPAYTGLQNKFNFKRDNGENGYINTDFYFIKIRQ